MKLAKFNQKKLNFKFSFDIIQLSKLLYCGNSSGVEHNLAKVGVASSNLVSRSIFSPGGGMVDTRDLKSLGNYFRAGSSPALGTTSIMATWPSGKAEACKAFTPSSNLGVASIFWGINCVILFCLYLVIIWIF